MKVIKNNSKEKTNWNIVCPHCDSILNYSKSVEVTKLFSIIEK